MDDKQIPTINLFKSETNNLVYFSAGETIMQPGEPGDVMYVVQAGTLEVRTTEGTLIEEVGPGGIVGEMALVDNSPRSAQVIALTDSRLVKLDQDQFLAHIHRTPFFALQVMRIMTDRLRRRTSEID